MPFLEGELQGVKEKHRSMKLKGNSVTSSLSPEPEPRRNDAGTIRSFLRYRDVLLSYYMNESPPTRCVSAIEQSGNIKQEFNEPIIHGKRFSIAVTPC